MAVGLAGQVGFFLPPASEGNGLEQQCLDAAGEALGVQLVLAAGLWFQEHGPLFVHEGWRGEMVPTCPPGAKARKAQAP